MAGWFAGRLAPAPVSHSQSRTPLVAGAPDSGHGCNDMVSNPVPGFGFSGLQSSNDVHIDYECLVEVSCMSTLSTAPLALMPFATHSHIHTHNVRVTGTRGPVSVRDVCVQGVQGSVTGPCSFWSCIHYKGAQSVASSV